MYGRMMSAGGTLRRRIPIKVAMLTCTPEKTAVIQSPTGTKYEEGQQGEDQHDTDYQGDQSRIHRRLLVAGG